MNTPPEQPSGIGRRSIVRGAAWSIPVVTVAAAAPAFATSPDPNNPTTLPAGVFEYEWSGAVSIERTATANGPLYQINPNNRTYAQFELFDGPDEVPAGSYYTNVELTLTWSAENSLSPTLRNAHGWELVEGSLTDGTTGMAKFVPVPLLHNGVVNRRALPQLDWSAGPDGPGAGSLTSVMTMSNVNSLSTTLTLP